MDLYNRDVKLHNAEILVRTAAIPDESKKLILRFGDHLFAQARAPLTVEKKLRMLRILSENIGDLQNAEPESIEGFFSELNRESKRSSWSKRAYILTVKEFYNWIGMNSKIQNLKLIKGKSKVPQLLSWDDILSMVRSTYHIRDKAMVAACYDFGGRAGEFFENLTIGDFVFENRILEEYVEVSPDTYKKKRIISRVGIISVSGKTGARTVELNGSSELIEEWIHKHPSKTNPKANLWVKDNGLPLFLNYDQVIAHLRKIAASAGVHKHITTNSFRHSRITAIQKQMNKKFLELRQGTTQLDTYTHLEAI